MLPVIRLTSLVDMDKIQKKYSFRTRLVGLISMKTKEYFFGRHLCNWSIAIGTLPVELLAHRVSMVSLQID